MEYSISDLKKEIHSRASELKNSLKVSNNDSFELKTQLQYNF